MVHAPKIKNQHCKKKRGDFVEARGNCKSIPQKMNNSHATPTITQWLGSGTEQLHPNWFVFPK